MVNCRVIDCVSDTIIEDAAVIIDGDRIERVVQGSAADEVGENGGKTVDLGGSTVLPGLWDVHCHPGGVIPDPTKQRAFETQAERTIRAFNNAASVLDVGVTSLRVTAEASYIDIALRDAFEEGTVLGPRLFCCGRAIKATGGHGSYRGVKEVYQESGWEVDGPHECRKAAREELKMGADQLKIMISGGIAGGHESMDEPQMTLEEMAAVCDVAHKKGTIVSAHSGGPTAIQTAIEAGVDCFEHGYYLDDKTIEMMAEAGAWYVPTLSVTQNEDYMRRHNWPEHSLQRALEGAPVHREGFRKALEAGIKIASGADLNPIAETALPEIEQLVKCGMSNSEALVAATSNAAQLCGVEDELGTVQEGKIADLIVVDGNPLDDIQDLYNLELVIKNGDIVVDKR